MRSAACSYVTQPLTDGAGPYALSQGLQAPSRHVLQGSRGGVAATHLAWHSHRLCLAVGWQDGGLSFVDAHSRCLHNAASAVHKAPLVELVWQPNGDLLAAADVQAKVTLWRADAAGRPFLVTQLQQEGCCVTHLTWAAASSCVAAPLGKAAAAAACAHSTGGGDAAVASGAHAAAEAGGAAPGAASSGGAQRVYFACGPHGSAPHTVKVLDSRSRSDLVQDVGEPIAHLLHYADKDQLVVITAARQLLLLARPGARLQWLVAARQALPGGGVDGGCPLQVTWAGQHTLAILDGAAAAVCVHSLATDAGFVLPWASVLPVETAPVGRGGRSSSRRISDGAGHAPSAHLQGSGGVGEAADEERASSSADVGGGEALCCMAYCPRQRQLCVCASNGAVAMLRIIEAGGVHTESGSTRWEVLHTLQAPWAPTHVLWGPVPGLLAVVCSSSLGGALLCTCVPLRCKASSDWAAMQVAPGEVVLERLAPTTGRRRTTAHMTAFFPVETLDVSSSHLLLRGAQRVEAHRIAPDGTLSLVSGFPWGGGGDADSAAAGEEAGGGLAAARGGGDVALWGELVARTAGDRVELCTLSGDVRHTLPFLEQQGRPCLLDARGAYLAVSTTTLHVRVFKLEGAHRQPTPHAGPGHLLGSSAAAMITAAHTASVDSIAVNRDGTGVAACVASGTSTAAAGLRGGGVHVYCAEGGVSFTYDLAKEGYSPVAAVWDVDDPRLLAVHAQPLDGRAAGEGHQHRRPGPVVALLAVTPREGLVLLELQPLQGPCAAVGDTGASAAHGEAASADAGCSVSGVLALIGPHLLVRCHQHDSRPEPRRTPYVGLLPLKGFAGLQGVDGATRKALLDFSVSLAAGSQGDALHTLAAVTKPGVWEMLAGVALRSRRLDAFEHLVARMGDLRTVRTLRECAHTEPQAARAALVAVQLGMLGEAEQLLAECGRHDLLCRVQAAQGQWEAAMTTAGRHDRVRLPALQHALARQLEGCGEADRALHLYQEAGTLREDAPRVLRDQGRLQHLPVLAEGAQPRERAALLTWWGRSCQQRGDVAAALAAYERAGNHLAIARLHAAAGNIAAAESAAERSGDRAVALHLGRLHECQGRAEAACAWYVRAEHPAHAARLALRHGLGQPLVGFALKSPPEVQVAAAEWLGAQGRAREAAQLFRSAGLPLRALDTERAAGLPEAASMTPPDAPIVDAQPPDGGAAGTLLRAGASDVLHEAGEALAALAADGQWARALDLLEQRGWQLTPELADLLTPADEGGGGGEDTAAARAALALRLGHVASRQGSYPLAARKFTQAGDHPKAMAALIKSGDTDKVVFFAGVSRRRDVYLMAATYLRTLDWKSDATLMGNLVALYSKAGAHDELANLFGECALMEVEEYRDYGKALQALQEVAKHLAKSTAADAAAKQAALRSRVAAVSRYERARVALECGGDAAAGVEACEQLLAEVATAAASAGGEGAADGGGQLVREGDVLALLVQHCAREGDGAQARGLAEEMAARGLQLGMYLDHSLLEGLGLLAASTPLPLAKG